MHRKHSDKSLRKGFSLVELMVGLAIFSMMATVIGGLFLVSFKTYSKSLNKTSVLKNARQTLDGHQKLAGIMQSIQSATSVDALEDHRVVVNTPGGLPGFPLQFHVYDSYVFQSEMGDAEKQAEGISSLDVAYYEIGADGLIRESTTPVQATFVTTLLKVEAKKGKKAYQFYSGKRLRNY